MYVIVIGCGRAGSEVASRLSAEGHAVVVIDREKLAFERLAKDFKGTTVVGQAIDSHTLESAGIAKANAVIATTYGDNSNLTAVQIARAVYNVPRAIARVKDPIRARVFRELGVETLCSTAIMAEAILGALSRPTQA
ncbi:MAG: TrkA family potassium uptake protein [Actinobacteria bacterium]|nr:TrkA family potassium uptake protein [Actinomycetota bacterium]